MYVREYVCVCVWVLPPRLDARTYLLFAVGRRASAPNGQLGFPPRNYSNHGVYCPSLV